MYVYDQTMYLGKQWNDKHKIQNDDTSHKKTKYLDVGQDLGFVFSLEGFEACNIIYNNLVNS